MRVVGGGGCWRKYAGLYEFWELTTSEILVFQNECWVWMYDFFPFGVWKKPFVTNLVTKQVMTNLHRILIEWIQSSKSDSNPLSKDDVMGQTDPLNAASFPPSVPLQNKASPSRRYIAATKNSTFFSLFTQERNTPILKLSSHPLNLLGGPIFLLNCAPKTIVKWKPLPSFLTFL